MKYYSTNHEAPEVSLKEAIIKGLAPDKGLYMPETFCPLPKGFFDKIDRMSFQDIACRVALNLFGEDITEEALCALVRDALNFDVPVRRVKEGVYALELFHGPTLAFKDVGARFMARALRYFLNQDGGTGEVNVLVATSGDTGGAVANGFLGVDGIRVFVLYPKNKVTPLQEMQFASLGRNITAVEVDGTFDDCQALVKRAFMDEELNAALKLTSANSINVARFLPQSFYYFYGYAQMKRLGGEENLVVSVPSGNFGNLCAGLIAKRLGLPIKRFVAANNRNDVFYEYLKTGKYHPRPSVQTLANAMDVGAPSNFARIVELYHNDIEALRADVSGRWYDDNRITEAIRRTDSDDGYLLDPHGACGLMGLEDELQPGENGLFLETAHPAKFLENEEKILGRKVEIPHRLQAFLSGRKQSVPMPDDFEQFKAYLLNLQELLQ